MGRVKLQIKRIENTTNRQVTFSKRRNGLIKKAYEISVLCDVDVALIMFSPSGRLSLFSGNNSVEEILARYVNLPDHERGRRLHNQEFLQRVVNKLRSEADPTNQATSPVRVSSSSSQLEEIQQEILCFKSQVEEMENRLRIFEGDHSEVTNSKEAEYRQHILEETMKNVFMRKKMLEKYSSYGTQYTTQIEVAPESSGNGEEVVAASARRRDMINWLPLPPSPRDPQIQILSLLDTNGLLRPLTDEVQRGTETIEPALRLGRSQNVNGDDDGDHINPTIGFENDKFTSSNNEETHDSTTLLLQRRTPQLAPLLDVTLSPWSRLYSTEEQERGRELHELYMSDQYAQPDTSTPNYNQNASEC